MGFTPEDRASMLALASSVSVAIRTARLVDRRRRALDAVHDVEKLIAASASQPNLTEVLSRILDHAAGLTRASAGWVFWHDETRNRLEALVSFNAPIQPSPRYSLPANGIVGRAARQQKSQLVEDVSRDSDYREIIPGTRSELAVPLLDGPRLIGVVNLESGQLRGFSQEDCRTVEMLGVLAAIAARVCELYDFADRQRRPLVALSAVAARLQQRPFDVDTTLRIILTGVTAEEGLGFSRAMVFLTKPGEQELEGRLAVGPLSGEEAKDVWEWLKEKRQQVTQSGGNWFAWLLDEAQQASRAIGTGNAADCDLSRRVQTIRSISAVPELKSPFDSRSCESALAPLASSIPAEGGFACVPLKVRENFRGILVADRSFQDKRIDQNDLGMLELFAEIAAIAVENRTFRTGVTDAERLAQWTNVVSEVTHRVGTRLTIIDGHVEGLAKELEARGVLRDELAGSLRTVRGKIWKASLMVRKIQPFSTQPVALSEKFDLIMLIEGLIEDVEPSTKSRIELAKGGVGDQRAFLRGDPFEVQDAFAELIRNADEAAVPKAGTSALIRVGITLTGAGGGRAEALIEVEDNGPGIPADRKTRVFEPGSRPSGKRIGDLGWRS